MDYEGNTFAGRFLRKGVTMGQTRVSPAGPVFLLYFMEGTPQIKRVSDLIEAEHFLLVNEVEPFPENCSYTLCMRDCKQCPVRAILN